MRSLHSSSSTTRSYCSRSMLLESGQTQSVSSGNSLVMPPSLQFRCSCEILS
uniref:Uncharacterized protein n=1 Tax=Arundo donax TaxID=35708 RepID=A0A0A9DX96_ARUDO